MDSASEISDVAGWQCPLWGSKDFNGCVWCRRPRSFPGLQFRGVRHAICNPCDKHLRQHHPGCTGEARSAKRKTLADKEAAYQSWCTDVNEQELKDQERLKKRGRLNPNGGEAPDKDLSFRDDGKKVLTSEGTQLEARKFLGLLWPTAVFLKEENRQPKKSELVRVTVGSDKLIGVVRDRSAGCPIGVTELWSSKNCKIEKFQDVASSETACSASEVDDFFAVGKAKFQVNTVAAEGADTVSGQLKLTGWCKKRKPGDDDDMDEIWGMAPCVASGGDEQPSPPAKPRLRVRQPGADVEPGRPAPVAKPPSQTKQDKEICVTEAFLLSVDQIFRSLGDLQTYKGVTVKQVEQAEKRINDRLAPALINLYAGDYTAGTPHNAKGMEILERARACQSKLPAVKLLVESLLATPERKEAFATLMLDTRIKNVADAGVPLPHFAEVLVSRQLTEFFHEEQWADLAKSLRKDQSDRPGCASIDSLEGPDRGPFFERSLLKFTCDLIRLEGKLAALRAFMAEITSPGPDWQDHYCWTVGESGLALVQEFKDLAVLLNAMADDLPDAKLTSAKTNLEVNKSLKLHKPLTLFPTGRELLAEASQALLSRRQDAGFRTDVDTLKQYVSRLPLGAGNDDKPKVDAKSGKVTVPGIDVLKETVLLRAKVAGGASDRFLKSSTQDLAAIDEAINQLVTNTCEVVQAHLADCAAKLLSSFQHACSKTTQKAFEAAGKTFSSCADRAAFPGLQPEVYLKGLLSKEVLDRKTEQYQDFKNGVDVLRSALGNMWSKSWVFGSEDSNLAAFYQVLTKQDHPFRVASDFQRQSEAMLSSLWAVVSKGLLEHLDVSSFVAAIDAMSLPLAEMRANVQALMQMDASGGAAHMAKLDAAFIAARGFINSYPDWGAKELSLTVGTEARAVSVPFNVFCFAPLVAHAIMAYYDLARISRAPTAAEVLQTIAADTLQQFETLLSKVQAHMTVYFTGSDSGLQKAQCIYELLETALRAHSNARLDSVLNDLQKVRASVEEDANDVVNKLVLEVEKGPLTDATLTRLLSMAQSTRSRDFYTNFMYLEKAPLVQAHFEQRGQAANRPDAWNVVAHSSWTKKAIAVMTTVQALQRPLTAKEETRLAVLKKCWATLVKRSLIKALPTNLKVLVTQQIKKQCPDFNFSEDAPPAK